MSEDFDAPEQATQSGVGQGKRGDSATSSRAFHIPTECAMPLENGGRVPRGRALIPARSISDVGRRALAPSSQTNHGSARLFRRREPEL